MDSERRQKASRDVFYEIGLREEAWYQASDLVARFPAEHVDRANGDTAVYSERVRDPNSVLGDIEYRLRKDRRVFRSGKAGEGIALLSTEAGREEIQFFYMRPINVVNNPVDVRNWEGKEVKRKQLEHAMGILIYMAQELGDRKTLEVFGEIADLDPAAPPPHLHHD